MTGDRRVALVANAGFYVGPELARALVRRDHDLVLGDPAPGLVDELEGLGAQVQVVTGVADLAAENAAASLVQAGFDRFGRIDSAVAASGRIVVGRFLKSSVDDLRAVLAGCVEAPYNFLRAVVPPMVERGEGQVLVITSASAARPTPGAPLYSSARAGATMLARNVAAEVAPKGVQVNAVGTNYMDFPEFLKAEQGRGSRRASASRSAGAHGQAGDARGVRIVLHAVHRRNEPVHDGPVRRVCRRVGLILTHAASDRVGSRPTGTSRPGLRLVDPTRRPPSRRLHRRWQRRASPHMISARRLRAATPTTPAQADTLQCASTHTAVTTPAATL